MSFGKLSNIASEKLGARGSLEEERAEEKPLSGGDQDYVLVDETDNSSDSGSKEANSLVPVTSSPAPVQLALEAPPAKDLERQSSAVVELKLDTNALAAWRELHSSGRANSVGTDRTDYSGLNEHLLPASGTADREQALQRALEELNQQHQWAMEAVIRGWEAEKAELMAKLENMTEARDSLEAELKHSENSFAGMLEGMLDQKLDQMLLMLQGCGAKPPSPRSSLGSPSSAVAGQPTVRKAQKVVHDLGAMLETMKLQQAAIEARVNTMQSAVLQLVPDPESPMDAQSTGQGAEFAPHFSAQGLATPQYASGSRAASWRPPQPKKKLLERGVMRVGGFFNQSRNFICDKVPKAAHATGDFAGKVVAAPIHFSGQQARRAARYLHEQGMRNEHITAVSGAAAGVLATTLLIKTMGTKRTAVPEPLPLAHEECEEIEIMGGDWDKMEEEEDGTVEVILNRNGVYRRSGQGDPALVIAWPI